MVNTAYVQNVKRSPICKSGDLIAWASYDAMTAVMRATAEAPIKRPYNRLLDGSGAIPSRIGRSVVRL